MLSFFYRSSNYKIVVLALIFIGLRLPLLLSGSPLLVPELGWMLTGEQLGKGFMLYRDIYVSTSPLSSMVYWGVDALLGRSQFAYQFLALLIGLFQILYFNYLAKAYDFFNTRTLIPGLIYAILLNTSFDMATLSPMLMATTFLLLAIGSISRQLARPEVSNEIFEVGIYIGIATLFYLPFGLFFIWAFVTLILFTGATLRHHLLGFIGSIFPILMVALIFFFSNATESLNRNLLTPTLSDITLDWSDISHFFIYMLAPLLLALGGFVQLYSLKRVTHFQSRIQQTMAFLFLASLFTIPFIEYLAPMQFILFIPSLAYFISWYFISFKKQLIAEMIFIGYVCFSLFMLYQETYSIIPGLKISQLDKLKTKPVLLPTEISNKKILVLGPDEGEYIHNQTATPYINWNLAAQDLKNLDNFESVIQVYNNFQQDPPEYIIDKENIMPKILSRIPLLKKHYKPTHWSNIYKRDTSVPFNEMN